MKIENDVVISLLETFGLPLPKQQRSLDTYHRILRSAQECVAELGYNQTTTQEVAKRAEISDGGLFKRFPKKVTLMAMMVGYVENQARKSAADKFIPEMLTYSTRERVRLFVETYWNFVQTPEFRAIDEVWDAARTDKMLLEALRPIITSDVLAGDLTFLFPELENNIAIQFISQMIYSSLECLSFNHVIGADEHAPEKQEVLIDIICREIDRRKEQ